MSGFTPDPERHGGIYCMINTGKPLTPRVCDILMYNAVDMFEDGRTSQRIKGRGFDGLITSNLKVIEGVFPLVTFKVMLATDEWEASEIEFYVRVDDLDTIHTQTGRWGRIMTAVMGIPPFHMLPPHIQQAIREGRGGMIPINPEDLPAELRAELEQRFGELGHHDDDDDDEPEYDLGEPTYG